MAKFQLEKHQNDPLRIWKWHFFYWYPLLYGPTFIYLNLFTHTSHFRPYKIGYQEKKWHFHFFRGSFWCFFSWNFAIFKFPWKIYDRRTQKRVSFDFLIIHGPNITYKKKTVLLHNLNRPSPLSAPLSIWEEKKTIYEIEQKVTIDWNV